MNLKMVIEQSLHRYPLLRILMSPALITRRAFLRTWISRTSIRHTQETLFAEPPLLSVPEFEGVFRVDARSHLFSRLLLHGSYEPLLAELSRVLIDPTRDIVDIGANIGFFTVLSAKHTRRRVLAIEPTDNALRLLQENIERNGVVTKIVVFAGVASDVSGELPISFVDGKEEYSSIKAIKHPSVEGIPYRTKLVASSTLDRLVEQHGLDPGFVKIDVEGAENRVLAGAAKTLLEARPILLSEFSPRLLKANGADPDALLRLLRSQGFRLVDPMMPQIAPGRREFGDLLGVPEERHTGAEISDLLLEAQRLIQWSGRQKHP